MHPARTRSRTPSSRRPAVSMLAAAAVALGVVAPAALSAVPPAAALPARTAASTPGGVRSWVTDPAAGLHLAARPEQSWRSGATPADRTIVVDPTRRYQRMTGFGASLTDSSAWVLTHKLDAAARRRTMTALFDPRKGIGLSMLRQPMGASDFAVHGSYSYDDVPAGQTDPTLSRFSVDHDRAYILPRLREALRTNPRLTVMATPGSAPGWMKTTDSMIGGSLKPEFYDAYARYFVKFLQAYKAAGVPVDYVSLQNEPLYEPGDYPGMGVPADASADVIGKHLGPALAASHLHTRVLAYDHNWDVPDYPEQVYDDPAAARYVPGTAWHCYGGDVSAQSESHNDYPAKQAFETECSGGSWQGTDADAFAQTMALAIGVPRNWGQSVVLWNLALDQHGGPTNGGCQTCRGVVTANDDGTVSKEVDYWALGHLSRFVHPGAVRIASSVPAGAPVSNVAFQNRDGSVALVAFNGTGTTQHFAVRVGDRFVRETLAPGAAATYRWASTRPTRSQADVGWVDLDLGKGPAGTPTGRLVQSVSPQTVDGLNSVRLGDRGLTYSLPYGAELRPGGASTTLPRTGWTVTASSSSPDDPVANMLDGDPATRWSSGAGQQPGDHVDVDLGSEQRFTQVVLDATGSPGDSPQGYRLEVSDDGSAWSTVARGGGTGGETVIALPPTTARYLRIVSTASSGSWWSIHELNLRTSAPADAVTADGGQLRRASGVLADGTRVTGVYNAGDAPAQVQLPVDGFGYAYWLPPTAAATFAVRSAQ